MPEAPHPHDEQDRLAALIGYGVLDTEPERPFDDVARIASMLCGTPIALVSLVDASRQWFKARVGLEVSETPREIAFCAHAILDDRVLVVEDASRDPRFADNALVTGGPRIRFYAGAPLQTPGGYEIGTVCVIDRRSRRLSEEQLTALQALARVAVDELALRRMRIRRDQRFSSSFLPLCAVCKKVRDLNDDWCTIETYLAEANDVRVSHGLCDACARPYDTL
jgi:GAF domain-containing protein